MWDAIDLDVERATLADDAGQITFVDDTDRDPCIVDCVPQLHVCDVDQLVYVADFDFDEPAAVRVAITYDGEIVTYGGEPVYVLATAGTVAELTALGGVIAALIGAASPPPTTTPGEMSRANKRMPARATAHDGDRACDIALQRQPAPGAYVGLVVNGLVEQACGDGTRAGCAWFLSGDGGITARAWGASQLGDTIHWNGTIAGYQLDAGDVLDLVFEEG